MAINETIWGAPETWRDLSGFTYAYRAEFKRPKTGVNSYSDLYVNEVLQGGVVPTDLSVAFWGINKNSILAHPVYLSSYWDNDEIKTAINRVNNSADTVPCILNYTGNSPSIDVRTNWNQRYAPTENAGESAWSKSLTTVVPAFTREIAISFNYQKIILVPWVKIALANPVSDWVYQTVLLKDYIDGRATTYANYNKIVGIGYRIALGDTNRSENNTGVGFVIPTNYEASEREYISGNTYKWFATKYGYYSLYTNGILGNSDTRSITPYNDGQSGTSPIDFSSMHMIGDADTGFRYKYCTNYNSNYGQVPIYYYDTTNEIWKVNAYTPWNTNYAHPFPYIECTTDNLDTVRDYVLTQIAYLGFPFVYDNSLARYGQIGETGVFLPKFDENGVTTGEYEQGRAALRLPNSDWTDGREGSGYDPTRKPGEEDFGDLTNRRPTRVAPGGLNFYVTNYMTIYNLQRYLNGAYTPSAADLTADFKGTNPGDYIVSAFKFPVALPANLTLEDIYIGKISSGFQAYRLTDNAYLDFGTIDIDPYFSTTIDFRDYQSKILLFMPFIGTAELDPKIFIGHTLGLIYNIDYLTGSVAAEIKRDGLTIETRTAKLAQTVPFFAGNMGAYQNELAQTGFAIEQSKIKQITGAITTMFSIGGAAATAAGGGSELAGLGSGAGIIRGSSNMLLERINQESLEYRLEHTQPQIGTISTASAGNAFLLDDRARVLIWRPYMLPGYDPEAYSHVVGNATLRAAALSEFSGYTVAAAAELSNIYTIDGTKSASEQELKLIKQALLAGVYV